MSFPHRLLGLGLWLSTPTHLRQSFFATDFLKLGRGVIVALNERVTDDDGYDPEYGRLERDLIERRRKQQQDEAEILARLEKPSSRRIIT